MKALAAVATLALATGCSSTTLPECGALSALDIVTVNGRDFEDPRTVPRLCSWPASCAENRQSYALSETCWFEIDSASGDSGAVLPGTACTRLYTTLAGTQAEEFLLSKGGTWHRDEEDVLHFNIAWDRRTREQSGTQSVGRSTWTLSLAASESTEDAEKTPVFQDTCGKRGSLPAEDHAQAAGCTEADLIDLSAPGANRLIEFGGLVGNAYAPRCIRIAPGQSVTWRGPFGNQYVLSPGLPNTSGAGSQPNPITYRPAGTEATHTFPDVGDFLFHSSSKPQEPLLRGMVRVR